MKIILITALFLMRLVSSGATYTAVDASLAAVLTELAKTSNGDTVNVPAGTATWSSPLIISNCVSLIGAGIGNTVITAAVTDANNGCISFRPNAAAKSANLLFRVSGFTLDLNFTCNGIHLYNDTTAEMDKIRIDNNRVLNAGGVNAGRAVYVRGNFWGVADNNSIENFLHAMDGEGFSAVQWDNLSIDLGAKKNFYFEDNILITTNANLFHAGGHGGRYISRYNCMTNTLNANLLPAWDMHGNQPPDLPGQMVCEIYGNILDAARGVWMIDQRGGTLFMFCNQIKYVTDWGGIQVREEYLDSNYPPGNSWVMHARDSYFWLIFRNGTVRTVIDSMTSNQYEDTYDLAQNTDVWIQNTSYNGTTEIGIYVGTTLPAACTTGDGAWITTQNTSDISGMVGKNPATPISGTFYKATAPNTWTAFYTPYTYPHPLRGTTPPVATFGSGTFGKGTW
jgi:hypothetical protein